MSLETRLNALATGIANDIKALRADRGTMASLTTTQKSSLVAAINELKVLIDTVSGNAGSLIDDASVALTSTYSSSKIVDLITQAKNDLTNGAAAALDTLKELADALGNDPNFATTILNALGKRVSVDSAQTFTGPEQQQARDNIGAASATALSALSTSIGDPDVDLLAVYTTTRDAP